MWESRSVRVFETTAKTADRDIEADNAGNDLSDGG